MRPLVSTGDPKRSVDISRRAELFETSSGLLTITGGKLTTWRRMAKLTVDRVVEREGREAPCRTHEIPLGEPAGDGDLPEVDGVDEDSRSLLAHRYGHAAREVLDLAAARDGLARRIVPDLPDLLAEAPFAAANEQANSLSDVLLRRTRLALLAAPELIGDHATAPRAVAEAMAPELGWDEQRIERELDAWRTVARRRGDDRAVTALRVPGRTIEIEPGRPLLMGIVNASPDSFSDGGRTGDLDAQVRLAHEQVAAGADLIDVGGESGVTDARRSSAERGGRARAAARGAPRRPTACSCRSTPGSPPSPHAVVERGAAMINDVSGLLDPALADACAAGGAALVIMHTRVAPEAEDSRPRTTTT